jgi:hypothetical protein
MMIEMEAGNLRLEHKDPWAAISTILTVSYSDRTNFELASKKVEVFLLFKSFYFVQKINL